MTRRLIIRMCICTACACITLSKASAQGQPPGTVTLSANATGVNVFESELDPNGRVQWGSVAVSGSAMRQMVPATTFRADFYGGVLTSAKLDIKDSNGDDVATTSYGTTPAIALTLSLKR